MPIITPIMSVWYVSQMINTRLVKQNDVQLLPSITTLMCRLQLEEPTDFTLIFAMKLSPTKFSKWRLVCSTRCIKVLGMCKPERASTVDAENGSELLRSPRIFLKSQLEFQNNGNFSAPSSQQFLDQHLTILSPTSTPSKTTL